MDNIMTTYAHIKTRGMSFERCIDSRHIPPSVCVRLNVFLELGVRSAPVTSVWWQHTQKTHSLAQHANQNVRFAAMKRRSQSVRFTIF